MVSVIHNLNSAAEVGAGLAWAVVWQSTSIIGVAALVAALFLRRAAPAVRFWLWQILAIKLLIMPFWTYALPIPEATLPESMRPLMFETSYTQMNSGETPPPSIMAGSHATQPAAIAKEPTRQAPLPQLTWPGALLAAWILVVALQMTRLFLQRMRLARLLQNTSPGDGALAAFVGETASEMGLSCAPRVVLTNVDCSPFVCGLFHPLLVLPRSLPDRLTALQLRHVAAHELAHIRRHDLLWGWFSEFARIICFFNPAVHWLCYRLRLERELACDEIAMAATGRNPAEYAATLVQVATHASQPALFCASSGERTM